MGDWAPGGDYLRVAGFAAGRGSGWGGSGADHEAEAGLAADREVELAAGAESGAEAAEQPAGAATEG